MTTKYKCLYEITGRIEDVATFLVPISELPKEPEQEPVAYQQLFDAIAAAVKTPYEGAVGISVGAFEKALGSKVYTTPPQHALMAEHWKAEYDKLKAAYKPLTLEQKLKLVSKYQAGELDEYELIEMVEAAHGIKE